MTPPRTEPIKVALFGMTPRSQKTMELFLQGPCRGIAVVVEENEAEIDILDADIPGASEMLQQRRQQNPERPVLLLALQDKELDGAHFLKKPINAERLSIALTKLKLDTGIAKSDAVKISPDSTAQKRQDPDPARNFAADTTGVSIDTSDGDSGQHKKTRRQSLFEENEGGYAAFLGVLSGIDFTDPKQLHRARFDPNAYFIRYVLSAYKVAYQEGRALQLNSIWKPLIILPDRQQIWVDADDKQLRSFAGIEQNKTFAASIGLVPVDSAILKNQPQDRFQEMDSFLWKLAVWTSKGRYPSGLEPDHPVYLKYWPNFTRLLLTPDALRITALLTKNSATPLDIIRVLNVKPQHVFAFITACHSLGILGKSERQIDQILAPEPPPPNKKQGLLGKILNKLRGA